MPKDIFLKKLRNCYKKRLIVIAVSVVTGNLPNVIICLIFMTLFCFLIQIAAQMRHHHHISLREQLGVAGASNNPIMQSNAPTANVTTPGSDSRKSIFNRLGIRKPSILSLSSPQFPSSSTARTFSLDDLLRPPPRRKHLLLNILFLL